MAVPPFIVNNPDETAVLLLALANRAGQEVARKPPGGWISMIREYDFTTAATAAQNGTIANVGNSAVISGLSNIQAVQPGIWIASGTGIPNNAAIRLVANGTAPIYELDGFGNLVLDGFGNPIILAASGGSSITLSVQSSVTGAGSFTFGQSDYPLPSDFERPIDNTFWDRSRFWSMRGPQSPQQWQLYKSSVIGRASIQRRYRFRSIYAPGGMGIGTGGIGTGSIGQLPAFRKYISIDPVPFDNGSQLVFEYVSNGFCQSTVYPTMGVPQSSWLADTDVGMDADLEYLIGLNVTWRLLRRLGLAYNEELDEYERMVDKAMAHDGGGAILNMTPNNNLSLIGPWNLPETNFGGIPT